MPMEPRKVLTLSEARSALARIAKGFRDGSDLRPVVFGARRQPEAVVVPADWYQELLTLIEDAEIVALSRERVAAGGGADLNRVLEELNLGHLKA